MLAIDDPVPPRSFSKAARKPSWRRRDKTGAYFAGETRFDDHENGRVKRCQLYLMSKKSKPLRERNTRVAEAAER